MSQRVNLGVRGFGAAAVATIFLLAPSSTAAQTTLVLDAPDSEVTDAFIRGGSNANTVHNTDALATKANSNISNVRRSLLKFDTETRIPRGTRIQSARLTLTLKRSDPQTRQIGVYRVTNSFQEHQVTWNTRKSGYRWSDAGGDLSSRVTEFSIGTSVGTRVTVDLTALVQATVNGDYGSRYTRVALADIGAPSDTSYKEFYSSETGTAANRPSLTVEYGATTTTTTGGSLPSGWQSRDIGSLTASGSASGSGSSLSVQGAGADVWGTADAFHFAYRSLSGDGMITARVASLSGSDAWTKVGVMVRASTAANAAHGFMLVSQGKGLAFQRRASTGASSSHTSGGSGAAPRWVRLARQGNTVTAYQSSNGTSWSRVGSASISLPSTALFGLAVTSHDSGRLASGSFASVTVEAGAPSAPPAEEEDTEEEAPSSSTSRIRVLHWNTHYGVGTDGRYDIDRIATYIARYSPDIVSLNEVTRRSHYNSSEDQAERYAALLRSRTGRTWYYYFRTDNGASTGVGNIVLSRFPIASTSYCQLSSRRVAVKAAVHVNGRLLNVWSTHLDSSSGNSLRLTEVRALRSCVGNYAEQKIVAGDFNAQASTSEVNLFEEHFRDGWGQAASDGTATDYPGNTRYGATRNTRIDYVFYSRGASSLALRSAQVYDTRSSSGVMPSDHKPLLIVFDVR